MISNDEELRYKEVIDPLKQLKKIKAPIGFEANLMRKINSDPEKKPGILDRFLVLSPKRRLYSKLYPAAALPVAAAAALFFFNTSAAEQDDPLLRAPKIRHDYIQSSGVSLDEQMKFFSGSQSTSAKKQADQNYSGETEFPPTNNASFISGSTGMKTGFNYKQIYSTEEQKLRIERLKEKIKSYFNAEKTNNK